MTIALVVHGGAGSWRPGSDADAIAGTTAAVAAGRKILEAGGSALDAACAAAVILEDNPIFNAGTGAVLNYDGEVEFDACVMVANAAQVGAVSALKRVKNPILVARQVMEETDHVMLTGEGALRFARVMGHADHDPITPARLEDWRSKRETLDIGVGRDAKGSMKIRAFLRKHPEYAGGTIGAVALDANGVLCAATSTAGVTLKLPGRVGDTPLPGAGTFADAFAASSATGTGEYVIRSLSCRAISQGVADGKSLDASVAAVLAQMTRDFDADVGFIGIDRHGNVAAQHSTAHMPHAWFSGQSDIVARMSTPK
ncbi:MAG: isoaspartyl peptidase/L-asparaginase [Nitrosomonadaceae bacterium]|jgi:beta-aspartyl-peptidase (threonine type)|nr:isoaspartyl peptidase/L-asparaginase [Nitrosomonadaceae bacterium]